MRIARFIGVILTMLIAGLLVASTADAQPPFRLPGYVTDNAGALSPSGRTEVSEAIDKLYSDRHIRLWVVYVDDFSGQNSVTWAQRTIRESDLGTYDALLAVATTGRACAFLVPSGVKGVTQTQVDELRRNEIEPALREGDWRGAAVSAANGLNAQPNSSNRLWLLAALGLIIVAVVALVFVMRYRRRLRRRADLAAARRVDPTNATALAAVPLTALDDLSRSMVVEVDNAVRTSSNELALAIDEFGAERTEPFTRAVDNAKAALSQAFTIRQQLDDAMPETPEQQRYLLTQVIVSAANADRELDAQKAAFEQLRDLVVNAATRLDSLTQQVVELTSRIEPAERRLAELNNEFGPAALTSVSGNVATAKERLAFADRNISAARALAGNAVSGQQSGLVDAVRASESALGQARALLDAVDNAAGDIRRAVERLPAVMTDIQAGIEHATAQLQGQDAKTAHAGELAAARAAANRAVDAAGGGSADPLGTFAQLAKADSDLNRLLAMVAKEQADAERLNRSLEQALFTAQARVRGVSEYIDTRRGSVGPDARTRLAEAQRHLEAAQAARSTNPAEAITHANAASTLAANAQSLANSDVVSAQRAYTRSSGGDTGAMLGGIIIGDLLSGGVRGGFGGWSSTSFGGSSNSSPGGSDGGFMGGGGRF
ncbi:MAG: TPM domain-containing protein [Actinomycetota bacterium]|uniref:TPM domain-containing protein n=1 Tax=Mycobacterium lentiflavum TaxID=141349 RepID=A0ABY3UMQ2_MYCLN|nr:TPM domain-containing protein [Mycobacterium lentiflavum]MEE3063875.1 TPM domain-containing protein [Actinomycetota bacterium]ULP40876.1 TPM domain-containing protein [Mycobacterium lentiflavum]